MPHIIVLTDFDGTVAPRDVGNTIARRFAVPEWPELLKGWARGDMGSRELYLKLFRGVSMPLPDLMDHIAGFTIDGSFPAFESWCRVRDIPIVVLSDGFDLYIRDILAREGLGYLPVFANHLEVREGSPWLDFPYSECGCGQCGNCKKSHLLRLRKPGDRVCYVGDGLSDRCVAGEADVVFAKDALAAYCREKGIAYFPFRSFADVREKMEYLLTREWRTNS